MKRVACVVGTRPEAIKMAPVIAALGESTVVESIVVSTGQHREMLDQVVSLFGIRVDRELSLMRPDQTLAGLTSRALEALDAAFAELEPDLVLAQGDTTTVLAASLAAFYRRIPLGHVEAGLRTGDLAAPFPEEANRVLATRLAALHFAPTERARRTLLDEGVPADRVLRTGNTVIDALHIEASRQDDPAVAGSLRDELANLAGDDLFDRPVVLVTGHRRENFGGGFERICDAIERLAGRFRDTLFVYPVHLNPRVAGPVRERLGGAENVRLIEPLGYSLFIALMRACRLVLTDSGGVQEEAPGLGKPVLVMRTRTERPEGVDAGVVRLVGADADAIVSGVAELLEDPAAYEAMSRAVNPYGDGEASGRIVEAVEAFLAD